MQELLANQELLWLLTVVYDLGLAILLYRFFGKYGLYTAVVLGIVLGNLQGGTVLQPVWELSFIQGFILRQMY